MAKKPKYGSKAWHEARLNDPNYAKHHIQELAKRAENGDPQAVENLMDWLTKYPDMRQLVSSLDNLATKAQLVWVNRMSGNNLVSRVALEEELKNLQNELLGPNPSTIDRMLASSVIVSYLGYQRAAIALAQVADQPIIRSANEKVLVIAQKRLQEAIRFWELHAGKKEAGAQVIPKLKLFDPEVG